VGWTSYRKNDSRCATTKEPNCSTRCFLSSRQRTVLRGLLVDFRRVRKKYEDQNSTAKKSDTGRQIK
jgi:hypothetical protein